MQLVAWVEMLTKDHGDPVDQLLHRRGGYGEHAHSQVLGPDRPVRELGGLAHFPGVARIVDQLHAEGLSERALGELDPARVTIAGTAGGRSVLGCMNDLAVTCRLAVEDAGGLGSLDLAGLHHVLQRHIYAARDYVPAIDLITTG